MFRDASQRFLNRDASSASFHATSPIEPRHPVINTNNMTLSAIFLFTQLTYFLVANHLISSLSIFTVAPQACLVLIALTVITIHFTDQQHYHLDQNLIKIIIAVACCQAIGTLLTYLAMQQLPFSEMTAYNQIASAFTLALSHLFIQPMNQIVLIAAALQCAAALLFQAPFYINLLCLLWPASLGMIQVLKCLMTKQINILTLLLYTHLLTLPLYLILSLITGNFASIFNLSDLLYLIVLGFCQIVAQIMLDEFQQQSMAPNKVWALQGIIPLIAIGCQLVIHGETLTIGAISILFIILTSIGIHK